MAKDIEFERLRHIQYFVQCLKKLPKHYAALDTNRLTLVHFAVQSLDLLGFFDDDENLERYDINKQHIIEWIYRLQIFNPDEMQECSNSGFKGGTFLGYSLDTNGNGAGGTPVPQGFYDQGHLAMTYTALCTLIALGDDLDRVERASIIKALAKLQRDDGSFSCVLLGSENDMRFLYCACAISYILNDWTGLNKIAAVEYIKSCRSWDGAVSLIPGQESHGGSTFCGVASMFLMGKLDEVLGSGKGGDTGCANLYCWRDELIHWCVSRQMLGMQGRPNKLEDTCYSYWIGGTLKILECDNLLDKDALESYIMNCQTDMGGFSKTAEGSCYPDLLHSFYSLAWLSLSAFQDNDKYLDDVAASDTAFLHPLDCVLGLSRRRLVSFQNRRC